jgi:transposase
MRTAYFITMDTHCRTTDICVKTGHGKLIRREKVSTGIPQLREVIESVPRPRHVAFEEGAMAGWLFRNLKGCADELIVCNPRRNALVAKEGDKDDPIDAEKLNDLYRSGHLRPVHQLDESQKAAAKQVIGMYHDRVAHRVAEGNQLLALCRRWGVLTHCLRLLESDGRQWLKTQLDTAQAPSTVVSMALDQWKTLERAAEQEQALHKQVCRMVKSDKVMSRVTDLPGYGPVRAATLITYLDTPWRFKSKSALWKYVGIGLRREKSGNGPQFIHVEQCCNRLLRCMVIGAAQCAIDLKDNAFAKRHADWIGSGVSKKNARRNVARDQVTAIWGMWKTDKAFDPKLICKSS